MTGPHQKPKTHTSIYHLFSSVFSLFFPLRFLTETEEAAPTAAGATEEGAATGGTGGEGGFTRPCVLILVPFRQTALEVIHLIMQMTNQDSTQVIERGMWGDGRKFWNYQ